MKNVYAIADNIISPLGFSTAENIEQLNQGVSGIKLNEIKYINLPPFYASLIDDSIIDREFSSIGFAQAYTKSEKIAILSIKEALQKTLINSKSSKTLFVISTTKGNIDLLKIPNEFPKQRVSLATMSKEIASFFQNPNEPIVVSNACISGVLAIITAKDLIESGAYENVVVCGCDIVSEFTLAGFFSFQAISSKPCRPFDSARDGISLGEGCGTIILSANPADNNIDKQIIIQEGATSNDANHISAPSRTGDGLHFAICKALKGSNMEKGDIDYVSAHGTGTIYNDEMETKALALSGLLPIPANSFKGYFGHTLGAAGVIESIVSINSMKENKVLASAGFENLGVSLPINIIKKNHYISINNCLKLASGFGGCNAAMVISKL